MSDDFFFEGKRRYSFIYSLTEAAKYDILTFVFTNELRTPFL